MEDGMIGKEKRKFTHEATLESAVKTSLSLNDIQMSLLTFCGAGFYGKEGEPESETFYRTGQVVDTLDKIQKDEKDVKKLPKAYGIRAKAMELLGMELEPQSVVIPQPIFEANS